MNLMDEQYVKILKKMNLEFFSEGNTVFDYQAAGDKFYMILEG